MKGVKKFFVYLLIIIGILVAIVLGVFAFMYFSPNTPVLGFEYVRQKKSGIETFTVDSDLSIQNIESVELYTENTDIYIYPNAESDEIKIVENCDFTGFTKEVNGALKINKKVEDRQYEENTLTLKAFVFEIDEPSGWISNNKSKIEVYVSNSLHLNTIFAKTTGGNIYYKSSVDENLLSCTNLFLKTGASGNVEIQRVQDVNNYYLGTENGSVKFGNLESVSADTIKFSSNNGSLVIANSTNDCVVNSSVVISSNSNGSGPYVYINKLNGSLNVNANTGTFKVDEIGSYGEYKAIYLTTNNANINFGTVYGMISLNSSSVVKNDVKINKLVSLNQTNTFITGKGYCVINNLEGNAAIETTTGYVSIARALPTKDVCVYTKSGDINVNYDYSDQNNKDNRLIVITNTGNINLNNVSNYFEVKVLSNSSSAKCDIGLAAVSSLENKLDIKDRQANLYFIGTSPYMRCRAVSTSSFNIIGTAIGSDISTQLDEQNVINNDYILDQYEGYDYSYRLYYNKDDSTYVAGTYNDVGRIIINSTKVTNIYARNLV